jgi:hypothetical protein
MIVRVFRDHQEKLLQDLQDSELATTYLTIALMDEDPRLFFVAVKNALDAQKLKKLKKEN